MFVLGNKLYIAGFSSGPFSFFSHTLKSVLTWTNIIVLLVFKVCLAPKRRFKVYDAPVARNANDMSVRKARKEDLKKANAAIG